MCSSGNSSIKGKQYFLIFCRGGLGFCILSSGLVFVFCRVGFFYFVWWFFLFCWVGGCFILSVVFLFCRVFVTSSAWRWPATPATRNRLGVKKYCQQFNMFRNIFEEICEELFEEILKIFEEIFPDIQSFEGRAHLTISILARSLSRMIPCLCS